VANQLPEELNRPSNEVGTLDIALFSAYSKNFSKRTTEAVNKSPMKPSPKHATGVPDELKVENDGPIGAKSKDQTSLGLNIVANKSVTNEPPAATRSVPISYRHAPNAPSPPVLPNDQPHTPSLPAVGHVTTAKIGSVVGTGEIGGTVDSRANSRVTLPSTGSLRASVESYPSNHHLVVQAMIGLDGERSQTGVTTDELLTALWSIARRKASDELVLCIHDAVKAGVLKRFIDGEGRPRFLLESPTQGDTPRDSAMKWVRSFMPSWL